MKTNAVSRDLSCDDNSAERPRYFPRQMITADDLTLEADYFRNKLRRHNRLMHGWGVACGALVCPVAKTDGTGGTEPWKVKVKPGYILGPYGDEILIDCERTVDLRTSGVTGITGEPCTEAPDPWCSEVFLVQQQTAPATVCVAVKYKEVMTRPVRVQPVGCGCDDTQCEYSRLRDGYEIGILKACPDSGQGAPNKDELFQCPLPECPDCPSDPWVVLAAVTLNQDGSINQIDNRSYRRLVAALGDFWWQCEGDKLQIISVTPNTLNVGETALLTITGKNLDPKAKIDFDVGISLHKPEPDSTPDLLKIKVDIDSNADTGLRTLTIVNPDCSTATLPDAITIQ